MRSSGFFTSQGPDIPLADPEKDLELVYSSGSGYCQIWKGFLNDRVVAFKSLKKEYSDNPIYVNWLRREYEIGRSLHHPGICETFAWETLSGIGNCIVLEWIEGESLEDLIARGPVPMELAVKIASEICDAAGYLHHKQIIHKDLKPENIIITNRGSNVKIIDFGLSDSDAFLFGKAPAGTLEYAAPEVIAGESADISSDIYSIGIILSKLSPSFSEIVTECTREDKIRRCSSVDEIKSAVTSINGRPRKKQFLIFALSALSILAICIWLYSTRNDQVEELFENAVEMVRESGLSNY